MVAPMCCGFAVGWMASALRQDVANNRKELQKLEGLNAGIEGDVRRIEEREAKLEEVRLTKCLDTRGIGAFACRALQTTRFTRHGARGGRAAMSLPAERRA